MENRELKEILEEEQTIIFTFGASCTGKSTLLGSLYLSMLESVYFSVKSKNFLESYRQRLLKNKFPYRNKTVEANYGKVLYDQIGFNYKKKNKNILLIEMSGDDLTILDPGYHGYGNEYKAKLIEEGICKDISIEKTESNSKEVKFRNFLDQVFDKQSNHKFIFLLTANVYHTYLQDTLLNIFLSYTKANIKEENILGILSFITIWDKKDNDKDIDYFKGDLALVNGVVNWHRGKRNSKSKKNNFDIKSFSIGKVENKKIEKISMENSNELMDKIVKILK